MKNGRIIRRIGRIRRISPIGGWFFAGFLLAAAVFPACGGSGEYSAELVSGPFLSQVTQDGAVITWQTDRKDKAAVEYGPTPDYGRTASGSASKLSVGEGEYYLNTVSIGGLEPVTWTHYRIKSLASPSDDYVFRTAPAPGGDFSFAVYGNSGPGLGVVFYDDWDNIENIHPEILSRIVETSPDFIINTGDLVFTADDPAEWEYFFSILKPFPGLAYYPVLGNHDQGGGEILAGFFGTPPDVYYSFDFGDSHFTVINSQLDFDPGSEQYQWLEDDFTAARERAGITRLFAFMHVPAYCSASTYQDEQEIPREYLVPLFQSFGVKIVFQGHVHVYERTKSLGGVVYVVTGAGGGEINKLNATGLETWTAWTESRFNFVRVEVTSDYIDYRAISPEGTVFDSAVY